MTIIIKQHNITISYQIKSLAFLFHQRISPKNTFQGTWHACYIPSVPGKRPLLGKHLYSSFQGVNVAASIQMYGNYIPGKRPCGPKSQIMFRRPWVLTRDTTVLLLIYMTLYYASTPTLQCMSLDKTLHTHHYRIVGTLSREKENLLSFAVTEPSVEAYSTNFWACPTYLFVAFCESFPP